MLGKVNENAESKKLYDWLQRQGCTDMYCVIVDEGFEKLEDFITGNITTADMQELADAAREGEGHSRAMSFDDSTFRTRLCQAKWFSGRASARMRSGYARAPGVNELTQNAQKPLSPAASA